MKIKVIDLLNKIANNEWIPIKIKYDDDIYEYENNEYGYVRKENKIHYMFLNEIGNSFLNDEVEIIEEEKEMCHKCHKYPAEYNQTWCEFCLGISKEEKKIPEKIPEEIIIGKKQPVHRIKKIEKKINEIISYLDYLKSKGE